MGLTLFVLLPFRVYSVSELKLTISALCLHFPKILKNHCWIPFGPVTLQVTAIALIRGKVESTPYAIFRS